MQTHNITILDATEIKETAEDIDNAENMTFEDIRGLQLSVDNGHFPWRLDPAQVISSFMSQKGKTVSRIRIPEIKTDKLDYEDGSFKVKRQFEDRYQILRVPSPALFTVLSSAVKPRYMRVKGIMNVTSNQEVDPISTMTVADVEIDVNELGLKDDLDE